MPDAQRRKKDNNLLCQLVIATLKAAKNASYLLQETPQSIYF